MYTNLNYLCQNLGSEKPLSKCFHGRQNNNEALNGVVWQKCPEEVYAERFTVEIGVCSAAINFNSGSQGIIKVLEIVVYRLGISASYFVYKKIKNCVANMNRK